jgi:hypothetical protein
MHTVKLLFLFICLITSGFAFSQQKNVNTRTITGSVSGKFAPEGVKIIHFKKGESYTLEKDRTFSMEVAEQDTVLLHIALEDDSYFVIYWPGEDHKSIILNRKLKKESQKTFDLWVRMHPGRRSVPQN